jgi:probable rRNA maturation factor
LRLVGQAEGRQLNREFRAKDYATNILTFDYSGPPDLAADLVICLPVVQKEARAQRKTLEAHLLHLVVHGILHACGLDHESDDEADAMEALEARILARFRIADPYGTLRAS